MSLRMPQSLQTEFPHETGMSVLEAELWAERAAALGRTGRRVETTLEALRRWDGGHHEGPREALVDAAVEAVWGWFVQRELCGFTDHEAVIEEQAIPGEVLCRLGAGPCAPP